jgi:hypothetical protein
MKKVLISSPRGQGVDPAGLYFTDQCPQELISLHNEARYPLSATPKVEITHDTVEDVVDNLWNDYSMDNLPVCGKAVQKLDQNTTKLFKELYNITPEGEQLSDKEEDTQSSDSKIHAVQKLTDMRMIPRGTHMVTHIKPFTATKNSKGKMVRRKNPRYVPNAMPMLPAEPTMHHTFRFRRINTSSLYRVDLQDLYQILVSASATNFVRPIFRTFRILNVVVRGSISAVGETATVSLRYEGTNTNQQKFMDSTNKVDSNAMVHRKPPPFSLASFWHDVRELESSQILFEVEYFGQGECYLDITLQAVLDCNGDVNFSIPNGTSNVSGRLYSLDVAGGFEPVGIISPP